jgi:hypothetical protein
MMSQGDAGVEERDTSGYTVTYSRDETQFPVYVLAFLAAVCLAAAWVTGAGIWFALGVAAAAVTYYNFPLLETERPQIGANQYGIFIRDFGVIRWRAVERIDLIPIALRALTIHELHIALRMPLGSALIADWRKVPIHRMLMRLQWSMAHNNVIRVRVDPLEQPPDEIHRTLVRMWRHFRS